MRVLETRDISEVLRCIPMELEIRKKGRDTMSIKDTLSLLKLNFDHNPYFKFYMIFPDDTDDLLGYIALIIRPEKEMKTIHLYRIWYNGTQVVMDQIKDIIKYISKETKCRRLTIEVFKNEKALEKKWGFKKSSVIMERRI
jgi:hypothetical protein